MAGLSESFKKKYMAGVKKSKEETEAKKKVDELLAKRRKRKKSTWGKLKRTVREAVGGSKTYLPKQGKKAKPKAIWKTQGEMAQREKLGEQLARLRRKGKK